MRFFTRFIYTIPFFVCLNASAQVSLHDDPSNPAPDPSAMLDVIANDKGMLVPRVSLTGPSDAVTVPTPAASLLVFNEASLGGLTPGYFYNSGTSGSPAWTRLMSGNTTPLTGTGATSKVAFWTSATDLGNNTNFHWDNSGNGKLGIGTAAPTADYLLTLNASGSTQRGGLRIPMAGSSSSIPAIYITAGNNSARGFLFENTTASNAVLWGTGSVLTSTNIVSGYTAYRNSSGLTYGLYGISGTNSLYNGTNPNTYAAFLQGRAVIASSSSPSSALSTDLEVRNTIAGAGNPATIALRQTVSNTTNSTVLTNLDFGDEHQTTGQARIQTIRGAAGGANDNPTDMLFYTTPDGSTTLTERMRISNSGNVGIGANPVEAMEIYRLGSNPVQLFHSGGVASYKLGNDGNVFKIAAMDNGYGGHSGSFATNDVQVLSMTNTGNVGIGNVAPNVKLNVGEAIPGGHQYVYLRGYGNEPGSWKGGAAFGYTSASVIMGELGGVATIGGHAGNLNAWADLAINSSGGNVGVGIAVPLQKLHVVGAGRFSTLATGSTRLVYANATGDLTTSTSNIDPNSLIDGAGTLNYVSKWTPDGNTLGNSQIFDNGTNVGIGTATPGYMLHVGSGNGDGVTIGRFNDQLGWNGTGAAPQLSIRFAGYRDTQSNFAGAKISAIRTNLCCSGLSQGTELAFFTHEVAHATGAGDANLTEKMRIGNGGNLGIGVPVPAQKLHVLGTGRFSTLAGTGDRLVVANSSGDLIATSPAINISAMVDGTGTANYLARWTDANTLGIGATWDNGTNVGIGTTAPIGKLHVGGSHANGVMADGNDRPSIAASGTYPQMVLMSGNSANADHGATLMLGGYDSGASGAHKHWSIGTAGQNSSFLDIGYHAGTDLNPHAGIRNYSGSTFMTILNTGHVGIGTLAPQTRLEVAPPAGNVSAAIIRSTGGQSWGRTLTVATDGGNDDPTINFSYRNKVKQWAIGGRNATVAGYTAGLAISEDGGDGVYGSGFGTTRVFIAPGGNMGIGTTAPVAKLHVANTSGSVWTWTDLQNSYSLQLGNSGTGDVGSLKLESYTTGQFVFMRPSNGNYHIDATTGQYYFNWDESVRGASHGAIHVANEAGTHTVELHTAGDSWLTGGNLGLGTTTPVDRLDVRSAMSVNEIKFRNLDGGDDSDPYRLRKHQIGSNNNELQLHLNDDADERFAIYGNSCSGYGCGEYSGNLYHWFRADGYAHHAGHLGVGTNIPNGYRVEIPNIGNASGRYLGQDYWIYSSERWKTNIHRIDRAIDVVKKLRGVEYDYSPENGGSHQSGFIVEEVAKVLPHAVDLGTDGNTPTAMSISAITPYLVEAIKEQQAMIEELTRKLEELQRKFEDR